MTSAAKHFCLTTPTPDGRGRLFFGVCFDCSEFECEQALERVSMRSTVRQANLAQGGIIAACYAGTYHTLRRNRPRARPPATNWDEPTRRAGASPRQRECGSSRATAACASRCPQRRCPPRSSRACRPAARPRPYPAPVTAVLLTRSRLETSRAPAYPRLVRVGGGATESEVTLSAPSGHAAKGVTNQVAEEGRICLTLTRPAVMA